jgi:dihydrofolate reductase
MRKIIVSEFITLDGVVEAPGSEISLGSRSGWTLPFGSDEFMKFKLSELFAVDGLLLGRVTYDGFASAWPGLKDDSGFADRMNSLPKYVVSSTLGTANWNNSQILSRDVEREIGILKERSGQDLIVFGSVELVRWLAARDLIDEWRLLVYPVILGAGKRLFAESPKSISLGLLESRMLGKGLVLQRYGRP